MERVEGPRLALAAVFSVCLILALHLLTDVLGGGLAAEGEGAGPRRLEQPPADASTVEELLAGWPAGKPRACILILARNSDLEGVLSSVRQLERRFNAQPEARYPYIYLNDQPFTPEFRAAVSAAVAAPAFFGRVPREHWSYPPHVDRATAAAARAAARGRMPYGGSESYRFMCRYFSGFFFDHPLLAAFDWYWRVEPGVHFFCDLPAPEADPFRHMAARNQSLAWTIVMDEVPATIPGLWAAVQQWMEANPQHVAPNNLLPAFVEEEEEEEGEEGAASGSGGAAGPRPRRLRYTGCHFWSNFEVGRLSFFRSAAYRSFFAHLDAGTGFFYERWGDAPVHTLAAAALLRPDQVYFARDIGYRHGSWSYCPMEPSDRPRCDCHPAWDALPLLQPHCQLDYLTRMQAMASDRAEAR